MLLLLLLFHAFNTTVVKEVPLLLFCHSLYLLPSPPIYILMYADL